MIRAMSTASPSVLFRADASPAMGIGHVMRCLTLAAALTERGSHCRLACTHETLRTVAALRHAAIEVVELPDGAACDPAALTALPAPDWVVIDHYRLGADYERRLRPWAERILVIDDLADRRHDCDILLDQTVGRRAESYAGLVPASALVLAGPAHALLRPGFAAARRTYPDEPCSELRAKPGAPCGAKAKPTDVGARRLRGDMRILVSLGGTDPLNATATVLDALAAADLGIAVTVVMGSAAPALEQVRAQAARLRPPAELAVDVADMVALMTSCDLAVGAAGTSALERCCLGLPTLLLVIADNQREVAAGLAQAGAAVVAVLDAADIAGKLADLAGDAEARRRLAEQGRMLCDGAGAGRLADLMRLTLRPATAGDGEELLRWRNDPVTRDNSLDTAEVARDHHFAWLERALSDPERVLLIAERDGVKLGMVRFDTCCEGEWRVSISVAPAARGRGIGGALLSAAILRLERERGPSVLYAEIRAANRPSQRIFEACGFRRTDSDDGVAYYRRGAAEAIY